MSTEYAKTRQQFGKPIGIYQAVSHKVADMLVLTESSKSATYYAAWAVEADAPDRATTRSAFSSALPISSIKARTRASCPTSSPRRPSSSRAPRSPTSC